mgnify:CR=1 FL=1
MQLLFLGRILLFIGLVLNTSLFTVSLKGFVVLLWVAWILTYFGYLFSDDSLLSLSRLDCDTTHFGCALAQGITNWLMIMAQLR